MAANWGPWSGRYKNRDGQCTYPYLAGSGQPRDAHEAREESVHKAEAAGLRGR